MKTHKYDIDVKGFFDFLTIAVQLILIISVSTQINFHGDQNIPALLFVIYLAVHMIVRNVILTDKVFQYGRKIN